jgi:hypothetical protein
MTRMKLKYFPLLASTFLALVQCGFGQAPVNDNFKNRTVLAGNDLTFIGTLASATVENPPETTGGVLTLSGNLTQSVW